MLQTESPIEYDTQGRMQYHPLYHPNHKQRLSEEELEYLCKFYDSDGPELMAMGLGKTEMAIAQKVSELRKDGRFEYYKNLRKHW